MRHFLFLLILPLLVAGCSPKIETTANGTPYITLTPRDLTSDIEVFTNSVIVTEMNGVGVVRYTTNSVPGTTSLRFKLSDRAIKKLHALHHYAVVRALNFGGARGEVLVGSKVVIDDLDIRGAPGIWIATRQMVLRLHSPEDAQYVIDNLTGK